MTQRNHPEPERKAEVDGAKKLLWKNLDDPANGLKRVTGADLIASASLSDVDWRDITPPTDRPYVVRQGWAQDGARRHRVVELNTGEKRFDAAQRFPTPDRLN